MAAPSAIAAGDPKRGNELFQQYCSGCHGPQGRGGRKSGFMLRPKNLTVKGYTDALPDEYLFYRDIENGAYCLFPISPVLFHLYFFSATLTNSFV